jgi:hypothetical protein
MYGAKAKGQLGIPNEYTLSKVIARKWKILLKCVKVICIRERSGTYI